MKPTAASHLVHFLLTILASLAILLAGGTARASIAYGSINNFDTVNDTGEPAHGFEIELDDIHSADVTYTFDWNHYGTPKITEDAVFTSGAWHTNVHVRYEAVWTNIAWSAYTAVPTNTIAPTQGHDFTDPTVNFGGEHFGVGFSVQPSAVKYNWLRDDGSHTLVLGPAVSVATPTFTYSPPVGAAPAQVQAAIVPPPAPFHNEFGDATWVKEIRTTTHTNHEVKLRDLLSPANDHPDRKDWRNGEPDEVEVEWQILQVDSGKANGGANGELVGAAEKLNHGDEVVTRRYEFYEYLGPFDDPDSHEALAQNVGPDDIHGTGSYSNTVVVGKFLGAQMSAVAVASPLGLIDHLPDGEVNVPYATRTVVISGDTNFTVTTDGDLPDGMVFDPATAQVYGTPNSSGVYTFHVRAQSTNAPPVTKAYLFSVAEQGEVLPPHHAVDTGASPENAGSTSGDGVYEQGSITTVVATPAYGYGFAGWKENGTVVSRSVTLAVTNLVNHSLVATFIPVPPLVVSHPTAQSLVIAWPTNFGTFVLQESPTLAPGSWSNSTRNVTLQGTNRQVTITPLSGTRYFRLLQP